MPPVNRSLQPGTRLSVVVPFHRNLAQLRLCLAAVRTAGRALPPHVVPEDLIVVADGAVDDPTAVAAELDASVLAIAGPQGPAVARTRGAGQARGDLLVFIDTDVVIRPDALARLAALFVDAPDLGAAFGAYDEQPADRGFFSQCRNLAHSFIHHRSNRDANTFWAGLGAVRADVFREVHGFDPRFALPSVEDIDLGYRIRRVGYRIALDPSIQGTHLKRWTLWSSVVSDIRDRGVPWTQLLTRYGSMANDLNLTYRYRLAVAMAYALVASLAAAVITPIMLIPALLIAAGLWWLDRSYYRFFITRRGLGFALAWFPFHILHHLCNGVSFGIGTLLYLARRWGGIVLPWTLPVTPWSPREGR